MTQIRTMKNWGIIIGLVAALAYWFSREVPPVPIEDFRRWTNLPNNESLLSAQPITLPCGITLSNRYIKAPMTEGLAPVTGNPSTDLFNLYEKWSHSGCAMLITGNVMVHRDHIERSGNVILDEKTDLDSVKNLAKKCKSAGNLCLPQLSHPGRQINLVMRYLTEPVSASDVALEILGVSIKPRPLRLEEIHETIQRFAKAAEIAVQSGFDGVQIHSAHGYLLSQFLSPRTNKRTDKYGGSLENRSRMLTEVIEAVKKVVGPKKIVGVKLNSADFTRGGFSHEDSLQVIKNIHKQALVDFIEISGGNYEQIGFYGDKDKMSQSTKEREAYFRVFAADAVKALQEGDPKTKPILALTGGMRTLSTIEAVLGNGEAECVGIARPLAFEHELPKDLIEGRVSSAMYIPFKLPTVPALLKNVVSVLVPLGETAWYTKQMKRIADGTQPNWNLSATLAAIEVNLQDVIHFTRRKFNF